ncbi:MAG: HAD family hydrolase [Eubacteriales bacterium]
MIIFDYGHTLCYEPGWDSLRGEMALFKYIKNNKTNATPEQVAEYSNCLFEKIDIARENGLEIHERQFRRFIYEYFGIELTISFEQAEQIFWNAAAPGEIMPDADKILDYLNGKGIRSAVISNIGWSGNALHERLNRLLPNNRFEFVIASSEYVFRKPEPPLFELAIRKSGLTAADIWYCGDNPQADINGAAGVGIYPVWYDHPIDCYYRDKSKETMPLYEHFHIHKWDDLIEKLEDLEQKQERR